MTTQRVAILLTSAVLVCSSLMQAQTPAAPQPREQSQATDRLPVRRVVLYKSGVGYFEHVGRVRGNQDVTIDFTSGQLDDVLKSLTALDLDGGRITNVGYNSEAGLDRRLGALRLPAGQNTCGAEFLSALTGARLEVRSATARWSGRLLSVEQSERQSNGRVSSVDTLSLVSDAGEVNTIALDPGVSVRILDADLNQEVSRYLTLMGSIRDQDVRRLTIATAGTGDRDVFVSYVSEVPVWKATYRLILPTAGDARKPLLQGWAIVDNTVGQDWDHVQLSLVAGAPQSFVQQISRPYYVQRPIVPLPERALLSPQTHQSAMAMAGAGVIAGTVTDRSSAIPGATVRVSRNNELAGQAVTDSGGRYRIDALAAGEYQVTFTLQGFKTVARSNVAVSGGMETVLNAVMEVGALTEEVNVRTDTPTVTQTAKSSFIQTLPRSDRSGGALGGRTSAGLPNNQFNITIDGVTSSNLLTSGDGFYSMTERVQAAQSSLQSAASADQMGDLFEYKLKEPVTIRKNQSALVPIASADVEAEKVSLWTAGNRSTRPLRAIWLKNTTPLTLDAGSFSVIEGQAFAGEGLMESLKAGERRLLSYALDSGLTVDAKGENSPTRITKVQINRGVVIQQVEERQVVTYNVRNEDTEPRVLVIEHPVRSGWTLGGTVTPVESTPVWHRFRITVAPKTTASITVEETHPTQTQYSVTSVTDDTVSLLVREHAISASVEAALREVMKRKGDIAQIATAIAAHQREIETTTRDQQRVRENMQALKGSREERDLLQRYVKQLGEQETRLDVVRKELATLEAARQKAQADLAVFIEGFSGAS